MRALVAFGSKYGSTAATAAVIAEELRAKGHQVDLVDLRGKARPDVAAYDLVVVGSSVFIGKWTKPAQEFLQNNAAALAGRKVALFVSCSDVLFPEKVEAGRKTYLQDVAAAHGLTPVAEGMFGGEVDFSKYGMLTKFMLSKVGAKDELEKKGLETAKPFDFRDWEQIRGWARALA